MPSRITFRLLALLLLAPVATSHAQNLLTWFSIKPVSSSSLSNFFNGAGNELNVSLQNLMNGIQMSDSGSTGGQDQFAGSLTTDGDKSTLAVYSGTITLQFPNGREIQIGAGNATVIDSENPGQSTVQPIAELMGAPEYRDMLMDAVKTAASQLSNNTDSTQAAELNRALATVVQVLSSADPSAAASIVEAAVGGLTQDGASDATTLSAINTVVAAASAGSGQSVDSMASTAFTAASNNGANLSGLTETDVADSAADVDLEDVVTNDDIIIPVDNIVVSPST